MLNLKKLYSDELLQLALLLSLLRVDPDSYLGLDIQTIGVGSLDLNNGSGWHTDSHTIVHRPAYIHPKNLDSILLNYERELFEDLNSLGRYNRLNSARNNIQAYLLNIEERAGPSAVNNERDASSSTSSESIETNAESQEGEGTSETAELSQEDMDLIEVLWKQDVDLGFTLVEPSVENVKDNSTTSLKKEDYINDDKKSKDVENSSKLINGTDDKDSKEKEDLSKNEDPWAGLPYTVDLETGEYILTGGNTPKSSCEDKSTESKDEDESLIEDNNDNDEQQGLLGVDELVGLGEDSLSLGGLDNDFTSELLADGCLLDGCSNVDGFLTNDSLGLPDGFNLEEALQLVGLDEVDIEKNPETKKKCSSTNGSNDSKINEVTNENQNVDKDKLVKSKDKEEAEEGNELNSDEENMIHTPQYHHHPHHRSFQSRVPFVRTMSMDHQRWSDITPFFGSTSAAGTAPEHHFAHPGHHNLHHAYPSIGGTSTHHQSYEAAATAQRNVILHNATLAPPVGDLNSTSSYHGQGSNLGSAVATSMNLTNSSEPMGADGVTTYKSEPHDLMYYSNATGDTMNQTADSALFSALLEEQLGGWNNDDLSFNVSDGLYGGLSNSVPGANAIANLGHAGAASAGTNPAGATATNLGVTDERMDASSDSAVSSMGSERVPSLDGEWMETGSNSSHTQADSQYSMDYNGKYRMGYDCGYSVPNGRRNCHASERGLTPVAQKKHHMFGKRCIQEQSQIPSSPLALHPAKYDYETAHAVAAVPPAQAYSGPIEGATGPQQSEIKYSCSVDFSRQQSSRSSLEHVHHNHTYNLPPESSGTLQRPVSRDKKARKSDSEEHLTRDEKRARALNVPIPVHDIINLPMDEFNERLSKYDLNESQLSLIRDIRRRGKNKVAAQNCRKRKLDQINNLSDEVKEMRNRKMRLMTERNFMIQESARIKEKFSQLYRHVFSSLRDQDGNPYNSMEYSLQLSADGGNVVLVPRSGQVATTANGHYPRNTLEQNIKSNHTDNVHQHQQHHGEHKD